MGEDWLLGIEILSIKSKSRSNVVVVGGSEKNGNGVVMEIWRADGTGKCYQCLYFPGQQQSV